MHPEWNIRRRPRRPWSSISRCRRRTHSSGAATARAGSASTTRIARGHMDPPQNIPRFTDVTWTSDPSHSHLRMCVALVQQTCLSHVALISRSSRLKMLDVSINHIHSNSHPLRFGDRSAPYSTATGILCAAHIVENKMREQVSIKRMSTSCAMGADFEDGRAAELSARTPRAVHRARSPTHGPTVLSTHAILPSVLLASGVRIHGRRLIDEFRRPWLGGLV